MLRVQYPPCIAYGPQVYLLHCSCKVFILRLLPSSIYVAILWIEEWYQLMFPINVEEMACERDSEN